LKYGYPYVRGKLTAWMRGRRKPTDEALSGSRLVADTTQVRSLFQRVATSYKVKPYDGRITLFALAERGGMTDSLFDPALGYIDPHLGWDPVAAGGVDFYELEGEHVSILREPYAQTLGTRLRNLLEREHAETG
jgi:thioesterase domain-containing protein